MCNANERQDMKLYDEGFSLIELIVVTSIMGILAAIVVPHFANYIEKAKVQVCNTNSLQLEKMYDAYLILENIDHTDDIFVQYIQGFGQKICPKDGNISYVDGKVQCNLHFITDGNNNDDGDEIPYL